MKHFLTIALALGWTLATWAQNPQPVITVPGLSGQSQVKPLLPDWVPFDLDFPGGTPLELVKAVEKALGTNVNVIIPAEGANYRMPPFRVHQVSLVALFGSLKSSGKKYIRTLVPSKTGGPDSIHYHLEGYGFEIDSQPSTSGRYLWRFQGITAPPEPTCKFFQLAPYLQKDLRVEDITTAITTGWDLMGLKQQPQIQYHKETKMLIAFGEAAHLEVIASVLKELQPPSEKVPSLKPSAPSEKK